MEHVRNVLLAASVFWLVSCGEGSAGGPEDGGSEGTDAPDVTGDDAVDEPWLPVVEVLPPEPASLPVLIPCREGWREVTDDLTGAVTCEPWPVTGRETCAEHETHRPGEPGCARVGPPCPDGDWATDLPADRNIVWVLAGAAPGGDGTEDAPYADLEEAVEASAPGDVIALGKGTYEACVSLGRYRDIWGACVEQTRISCTEHSGSLAVVTSMDTWVGVRNVTISGSRPGLSVSSVGNTLDVRNVVVSAASFVGVQVSQGAELTARDLVVRGTLQDSSGNYGMGLQASSAGRVVMERVTFRENSNVGILASDEGTEVILDDAVVIGTHPVLGGEFGLGMHLMEGASATLDGVVFEENAEAAVRANEVGTTLVMNDCVVRDTLSRSSDLEQGAGLNVSLGATAELGRTLVEDNRAHGMVILLSATVHLTDVIVRGTEPRQSDMQFGRGINVQSGSHLEATRVLIDANHDVGLFLGECTGTWEDLVITDTNAQISDMEYGRGLQISDGSVVDMSRVLVRRNREIGMLFSDPGTVVTMTDVEVTDTLTELETEKFGHGLQVIFGATSSIERARFADNMEAAVLVGANGATLELAHVNVEDTTPAACSETSCPGMGAGVGLVAVGGGYLQVRHFHVSGHELCGISLAFGKDSEGHHFTEGGMMDLHDGIVSLNPIGANVQVDGFDLDRLTDGVFFLENDRNLDSSFLPVPSTGL